ncbi:MAG: RidA family protein [Beijerinckiaceae bacterium]|nr:RidA family protein [Beijerinckiaceae bacterium]
MTRRLISTGSPFEKVAGYSRAVVQGPFIFVSGTTGYDYKTMTMPEDVATQAHNCLQNVSAVLNEAGAALEDVVRVTYVVTDRSYADIVMPIFGQYFGLSRPAAMLIVAGLLKPEMKIEIEATAYKG